MHTHAVRGFVSRNNFSFFFPFFVERVKHQINIMMCHSLPAPKKWHSCLQSQERIFLFSLPFTLIFLASLSLPSVKDRRRVNLHLDRFSVCIDLKNKRGLQKRNLRENKRSSKRRGDVSLNTKKWTTRPNRRTGLKRHQGENERLKRKESSLCSKINSVSFCLFVIPLQIF